MTEPFPATKVCRGCNKRKPLPSFHKHPQGLYGKRSQCKKCLAVITKRWRTKNSSRIKLVTKKYEQSNKRRIAVRRACKTFGITPQQYRKLKSLQHNRCAICRRKKPPLCLDHDHTKGSVRGFLCRVCNVSLGRLGDSIASIKSVLAYLLDPPFNQVK